MPLLRGGRQLKRWRYVGVYGPDLMLCAGRARVGVIPQGFWGVVERGRPVRERTATGGAGVRFDGSRVLIDSSGVRADLLVEEGGGVECVNAHGGARLRLDAQAGGRARARVGRARRPPRRGRRAGASSTRPPATTAATRAGCGRRASAAARGGERVGWNLVTGVNDGPSASERTVWVDGEPVEVGPVEFAHDLSRVGDLDVRRVAGLRARRRHERPDLRVALPPAVREFSGTLPNGLELAEGYGVMESHDVTW